MEFTKCCCSKQLIQTKIQTSPFLKIIFDQSLQTGKYGFQSKHSIESRLLITTDESNLDSKTQTDVVVSDFSKAFDVVPNQRLLQTTI